MGKHILNEIKPKMREVGLIVRDLPDEVLVYDLDRHRAHCLNRTAATIWKHCDGTRTPPDIARMMEADFAAPVDEDLIRFGIKQLTNAHLLQEAETDNLRQTMQGLNRRQAMKIGGALLIPLVSSIIAPTAYAGSSCATLSCLTTECTNSGFCHCSAGGTGFCIPN